MRDEPIFFMDLAPLGEKDEHGDPKIERQASDVVFAEIKSISQNEFYQAQTAGKKPEIKFKITDYMDYQNQKYLVHNGVRYKILRTFRAGGNELEVTCYGGVRDAGTAVSDQDQ